MIVDVSQFSYSIIENADVASMPAGNRGTRAAKRAYKNLICAFDIEASHIPELEQNILYVWQVQIDEVCTVIGRTVDELMEFFMHVNNSMRDNEYLIFYVHNLSYEWQFIRCLYDMPPESVFAVKSRKILKCDILNHIELRCSYLHSNLSLKDYTRKMGVVHQKQSGEEFDYSITRYPDTPLTKKEIKYIVHDVLGLVEAIKEEMRREGDCIYTFPLTSTGYVRRDVKKALRGWNRQRLLELFPTGEVYTLLREEFRGGNTHANRYYTKNPDFPLPPLENVKSADRSSSYPDVIVNYKFPMTKFREVAKSVTYEELTGHYINDRGYAILTRLTFTNIELKDKFYPCPYISLSKCRIDRIKTEDGKIRINKNYLVDNGRILNAEKIGITVNDIDLRIIDSQYKWEDVKVETLYFARYDYLPDQLRDLVKEYYKQKTELKGIAGQEIFYDKFKNLINSIYGCMAQDPGKLSLLYNQENEGDELFEWDGVSAEDRLLSAHPTQPYQWGCWVTAWARYQLELAIEAVHKCPTSNFVYADTDSVKYKGEYDWNTFNERLQKLSIKNGAYADDKKGHRHYMGVFEIDGVYRQFETMGAKSYIYTDNRGFHITIAGVPKQKGAREMARRARIERRLRGQRVTVFDLYKDGFIFSDGVTITKYNDKHTPEKIIFDGHEITLTSNISILDSTHEIGLAADYKRLLDNLPPGFVDII